MSKMLSVINFTLIYWLLLFLFPLLYFISIWMSVAALFCVIFPQLEDAHPQRPQMLLLQYRQHQLIFTLGLGMACSTHTVANFHLLPCRRYLQCQHVWPVCKSHDQEQFAASLLYPALFVSVWLLLTWILNWVLSMNITWASKSTMLCDTPNSGLLLNASYQAWHCPCISIIKTSRQTL